METEACCNLHIPGADGSCCDPEDCIPCCPACPSCPTSHRIHPAIARSTDRPHRPTVRPA